MGRGAPNKKGLSYFPKMIDFYEDDKVFDLLDRYGPLGVTVYDCILCIVYKQGYYAEISLDKLSRMITRMIGNKWVKGQKAVVQVVHFCSEIGLIDDDLMTENIITSVGIQRRYYEIAVKRMKRQLYSDKYWLLGNGEEEEPFLNEPKNRITSEENRITSEENKNSSEESPIEIKEKRNIDIDTAPPDSYFSDDSLNKAFLLFLKTRREEGARITEEQVKLLKEDLKDLSTDPREMEAIVRKATVSGWKSFYPIKKQPAAKKKEKKTVKNTFNAFPQRDYDFDALERTLNE